MRKVISAFTAVLTGAAVVNAQQCTTGTAKEITGNVSLFILAQPTYYYPLLYVLIFVAQWYCSEVKAITYSNFPGTGSYNKVTDMDADSGQCASEKHTYSGSLAPLSEEVGGCSIPRQ